MKEIIRAKKQGHALTKQQIQYWLTGLVDKSIPEYQTTALLMAIYFKGMSVEERSFLTQAMAESGDFMNYADVSSYIADKHSSGGIGDKTSLILAPLLASLGLKVPMVSGRGLGFTGGTLDKLEAIPGYNVSLSFEEMKEQLNEVGCFIAGQTGKIAPADKILYSLRDVTETVDELSLITASILSKKFTEDLNGLILDIKCGSGAFMKDVATAEQLAKSLVNTATIAGIDCNALISRMDYPIGQMIGNLCETYECLQAMTPETEYLAIVDEIQINPELKEKKDVSYYFVLPRENITVKDILILLTAELAAQVYCNANHIEPDKALIEIKKVWHSGMVLEKFQEMVTKQGGDLDKFNQHANTIIAKLEDSSCFSFSAARDCYISSFDGEAIGNLMVELNAGRKVSSDIIDHDVSMKFLANPGQKHKKGETLLKIYHLNNKALLSINSRLEACFEFSDTKPADFQLILKKV